MTRPRRSVYIANFLKPRLCQEFVRSITEDAVGVEAALHRHFAAVRVNRVNNRREFFYTTPAEVKEALSSIDGSIVKLSVQALK